MTPSLALVTLLACTGVDELVIEPELESEEPIAFTEVDEPVGLVIQLSNGELRAAAAERLATPEVGELSEAGRAALLARLPALPEEALGTAFALRDRSLPPPRTGETVSDIFPPPADASKVTADAGAVAILRYAPEGDVEIAPHLSVSFNQPMVALTSQDEAAKIRPVSLSPEPPGQWRWVGTRTVLFEPDVSPGAVHRDQPKGFPKATTYTVTVPAGTSSATGEALAEDERWTFSTPPATLASGYPSYGPHPVALPLVAVFDQRVDAEALLPHVQLSGGGLGGAVALRVADRSELEGAAAAVYDAALPGRAAAFMPLTRLKRDTSYRVTLGEGLPSAEGPRLTEAEQSWDFYTYPPLQVAGSTCQIHNPCQPYGNFNIYFNNPLDPASVSLEGFEVSPELELRRVDAQHTNLRFLAPLKGSTVYTVTVPAGIADTYGQILEAPQTVEIHMAPASPMLQGPGRDLVVLDPAGPPTVPIYSMNHEELVARVWEVTPEDWPAVTQWHSGYYYNEVGSASPPLRQLERFFIDVDAVADETVETAVDLAPYLGDDGLGHLLVEIQPTLQPAEAWQRQSVLMWVQRTELGLAAVVDHERLTAWVTELKSGAAVEGAEVSLLPGDGVGVSSTEGLAALDLGVQRSGAQMLVARRGDDVAFLPHGPNFWSTYGNWYKYGDGSGPGWHVFDDRALYKPGETVTLKGWIRWMDRARGGDVRAMEYPADKIQWILYGPQGNELGQGEADVSEDWSFDLAVDLPGTANLGQASLYLNASSGGTHYHYFEIQEFRRPEYEVSAVVDAGPHILGEIGHASVNASYYAGGGLQGAPVSWSVTASPGSYRPPGHEEYAFGTWSPWWGWWGWMPTGASPVTQLDWSAETDVTGAHYLDMHFESMNPARPMSVQAQAAVQDVNRQSWTSTASLVVHPSSLYVGLKTDRSFYEEGATIEVESLVVDIDGAEVADRAIALTLSRMEWALEGGEWTEAPRDEQTCAPTSGARSASSCSFTLPKGGRYQVLAQVSDDEGRASESELSFWVSGGDSRPERGVSLRQVQLIPDRKSYTPGDTAKVLIQAPFHPASALVTLRREGVVETRRIELTEADYTLEIPIEEAHIPDLTVAVDLVGAEGRTDDEGQPVDGLPLRPSFGAGELKLPVPPRTRTLRVEVTPDVEALTPGGETAISVRVTGHDGAPVRDAEVAVLAVDEAVLALSGYQLADPLDTFYADRGAGAATYWLHHQIWLAEVSLLAGAGGESGSRDSLVSELSALGYTGGELDDGNGMGRRGSGTVVGGSGYGYNTATVSQSFASEMPMAEGLLAATGKDERSNRREDNGWADANKPMDQTTQRPGVESDSPIALRKDFSALALFAPAEKTGADGVARVSLKLPDSLTRYRVMAVAVSGADRFGTGEGSVTARKPLMVRPSPPRFLNYGDRFELPVVLQNQTDKEMTIQLAARAGNMRFLDDGGAGAVSPDEGSREAGLTVSVPAQDRVEVRIPAATTAAGEASVQVVAASGAHTDAATFELPVWTPATTEAFATYGEIDASGADGAIVQPLEAPPGVVTQFGGLDITTSSTQLQALTDGLIYLTEYPYSCSEQLASRVLGVAGLRDVLAAFEAPDLQPAAVLEASVEADIARLAARQNGDGGWAYWRRNDPSVPYLSIHVAHALTRAKQKGYDVPAQAWSQSLYHLRNIESFIPHWYGDSSKRMLRAYALYVRHHAGDSDIGEARRLYRELGADGSAMESLGWILPTLHAGGAAAEVAQIERLLSNRAVETAGAAHFTQSYGDDAHLLLHSNRRTDGVILEALIEVRPESDLIPKIVRGLLSHRSRGRWTNTQENAFILLALDRYFAVYESVTPDFVARAWLGDGLAAEHAFKGRTTERHTVEVPMAWLTEQDDWNLTLAREGEGRLYYRLGLRYAPADLDLEPADRGFAVDRVYEAVDDPDDVQLDADGVWTFAAGARVKVTLTMVAPARRYHVALVDPLPAGLEVLNPALATTGALPEEPAAAGGGRYWWWHRAWYEHQNMRDERVEAFTSLLWEGVHSYTYYARATTPGQYVVPPTKAEEMYAPETFGRGATDRVIVR